LPHCRRGGGFFSKLLKLRIRVWARQCRKAEGCGVLEKRTARLGLFSRGYGEWEALLLVCGSSTWRLAMLRNGRPLVPSPGRNTTGGGQNYQTINHLIRAKEGHGMPSGLDVPSLFSRPRSKRSQLVRWMPWPPHEKLFRPDRRKSFRNHQAI
jgi:hypothetical protein